MAHFTAAETQGDLHLVAFFDKAIHVAHLHVVIVRVDVGTHLDLFDILRLLRLARSIRLLLSLVAELANIEELADRRIGVG